MDGSTARGHDAPTLHLDGFEGPLDLLLDLARRQRVDLARISIATLVDQYVTAVTEAAQSDLLQAADWLVMAAWLAWMKSRLLLPADAEETREADEARKLLTDKLIELERVRTVADWLGGQPQLGWDVFERGFREPVQGAAPAAATFLMLMETCVSLFRQAAARPEQPYQPRGAVGWTPRQAMARMLAMLGEKPLGSDLLDFLPAALPGAPDRRMSLRIAISSTLAASLELARDSRASLRQDSDFGPIEVRALQERCPEDMGAADTGEPAC